MMEITTPVVPEAPLTPGQSAAVISLAEALAGVTGLRETSGRRYSLVPLLLLMVAGLLCKATSLRAVTCKGGPLLERLDAQELDQCITTWTSSNTPSASGEDK
jgi:hypothetical protein